MEKNPSDSAEPASDAPLVSPPPSVGFSGGGGRGDDSLRVILTFCLYTMSMFSLPFMAFFGTKYTLKHSFHLEGFPNTAWSVVAAVIVINVIILSYACKGYEEVQEDLKYEEDNSFPKKTKSDLCSKKVD